MGLNLKRFPPRLYLVTDRKLCLGRDLLQIVEQAVKGGAGIVQLREKDCCDRRFYRMAVEMKEMLAGYSVPLLINDRIDIALAAGADGIHLGQNDVHPEQARKIMGQKAIIGLSVESPADIKEAENYDLDYIAVSPVFTTPTKTDTVTEWGLEGLKEAKLISRHPVIAIGGINKDNAGAIIRAGADCIAVVSAVCSAPDPKQAAKKLLLNAS